jgi:hypothetical protein
VRRLRGGVGDPRGPSRFFNRADGFASDEPITEDMAAQVCDFYREQGVSRGMFMIALTLLPSDWASTSARWNLSKGIRFIKLGCDVETSAAMVMMTTFGSTTPPAMTDLAAARRLRGPARACGTIGFAIVVTVLAFCGWALAVAVTVAVASAIKLGRAARRPTAGRPGTPRQQLVRSR